jgi:hypothetical protein
VPFHEADEEKTWGGDHVKMEAEIRVMFANPGTPSTGLYPPQCDILSH